MLHLTRLNAGGWYTGDGKTIPSICSRFLDRGSTIPECGSTSGQVKQAYIMLAFIGRHIVYESRCGSLILELDRIWNAECSSGRPTATRMWSL